MEIFLMELEVEAVQNWAATCRVVKEDFVDGVLMIGDTRLVPIPFRLRAIFIAFVLIDHGDGLVLVNGKHQSDKAVATKMGQKMMLVYTWLVQHLTEEFVSVAFADGLLHQFFPIGMHDDGDTHFLGIEAIAHQAGIGGGLRRRGHGMLCMRVVESVGRRPTIGITAAATRRQGMQGRRFTDAELHVVGGGRSTHAAHINGAFGSAQQHQLAKRNVVQAEVVTVATCILVQDGDGGRGGSAAVP